MQRTFFAQGSVDLKTWYYLPVLEFGAGTKGAGIAVAGAPRFFLRLRYIDALWLNSEQEAREADFDGDGVPNWVEVELAGSDPFDPDSVGEDTDGDGIPDWWEILHGLDPENPADASAADAQGVTNLEKYQTGRDPSAAVLNDSAGVLGLRVYTPLN